VCFLYVFIKGDAERVETAQQKTSKSLFLNLSLFQFLSFVRRGVFYTFMINYLFILMQTATSTALLGTLNMVASALGQNLLWGRIADRHKLRIKLIITGGSIAAITYFIVYQIHKSLLDTQASFVAGLSLIFGLSFLEFFWSMSDVGWAALLADVTTKKSRGRIVGFLNFIASLGRTLGITFASFLYLNGEGFRQGTIFYIVVAMLLTSATIMWITSKFIKTSTAKAVEEGDIEVNVADTTHAYDNKQIYNWFLISLIIIVIGATCVNQVFLLFLKLPAGLNATDPEMGLILISWTGGGMLTCLLCGWLADRIGRAKVLIAGLILAIITPLLYGTTLDVYTLALVYGLNGVSFWSIQTIGFTFAGDIIPERERGRLFSRYNTVMALSWGPAGLFVGGPLADFQTNLGRSPYTAYVNVFSVSSVIVAVGTILFAFKVLRTKTR
jgi:MFS family permease